MRVNRGKIDRRAPDEVDGELCTGTANVEGLNYNTGNCLAELFAFMCFQRAGLETNGCILSGAETPKNEFRPRRRKPDA